MVPDEHSFGFSRVSRDERRERIGGVFGRAAGHYDLMNDVMSLGAHRLWKRTLALYAAPRDGEDWLDLACGSGDMAALLASPDGASRLVAADPSAEMLDLARSRADCQGERIRFVRCNAERLPFDDWSFDGVCCAFGLRNFTDLGEGLSEARRVLRPGGRMLALEFSRPCPALAWAHRRYLLEALPALGEAIAGDPDSYRYLGESILVHPGQREVAEAMERAGFARVSWNNLSGGVVAIHRGWSVS